MSAVLTVQPARSLTTSGRARSIAALAVGIALTLAAVVVAPLVVLVAAVMTLIALGVVALGRAAQPLFDHLGFIAR